MRMQYKASTCNISLAAGHNITLCANLTAVCKTFTYTTRLRQSHLHHCKLDPDTV